MVELSIVEACASAGQLFDTFAGADGCNGGRRGGVADAHVAGTEEIETAGKFIGDFDTGLDRFFGHGLAHGRADGDIAGPEANLFVNDLFRLCELPEIGGNPHVDDKNLGSGLAGQRVDPGPAAHEVVDHLRGNFLRVFTDIFRHHAMVPSHGDNGLPRYLGLDGAGHPGDVYGQIHQIP
ncbi:MAG: hypothetical protein ACD_75C00993G0003 [uncultured bacterium]|nr:MAG: hypothetical protein ACD_75C00993G0003 [uncultured bacterium]